MGVNVNEQWDMLKGGAGAVKVTSAKEYASQNKVKILVIGGTGTGKTYLCATAAEGDKVVIGLAEPQGMTTIRMANPEAIVFPIGWREPDHELYEKLANGELNRDVLGAYDLDQFAGFVQEHHAEIDAAALDGITEAQEVIQNYFLLLSGKGHETPSLDEFQKITKRVHKYIRKLRDLPVNFLCTALQQEDVLSDSNKVIKRMLIGGQRLRERIPQMFTAVGMLGRVEGEEESQHVAMFSGRKDCQTKPYGKLRLEQPPDFKEWVKLITE